jgi:hypothetical protein
MIFQIIDNTSWASLLVNESKIWQRETRIVETENKSKRKSHSQNTNDNIKTIQLVIQENGENHV